VPLYLSLKPSKCSLGDVRGHSSSLKMVQLESFGTVSYLHSTATMAASLAVSTQYTNVTDTQTDTRRQQEPPLCMLARRRRAAINVGKSILSPFSDQSKSIITCLIQTTKIAKIIGELPFCLLYTTPANILKTDPYKHLFSVFRFFGFKQKKNYVYSKRGHALLMLVSLLPSATDAVK